MELELLRLQENVLEFNVLGEDHTLFNILRHFLSEMPEVQFAAYKAVKDTKPKFYVRVQPDHDPIAVVSMATERIRGVCNDLLDQVKNLKP